jgi:hypothetical protein
MTGSKISAGRRALPCVDQQKAVAVHIKGGSISLKNVLWRNKVFRTVAEH